MAYQHRMLMRLLQTRLTRKRKRVSSMVLMGKAGSTLQTDPELKGVLDTLKGFTNLRFSKGPAGCRSGKLLSERRLGSSCRRT